MNKVVVLLLAILMLMLVQSNSISNGVDARLLEGKNKKEVKTVDKNVVNKEGKCFESCIYCISHYHHAMLIQLVYERISLT